ncbi:hypothetical protein Tco_1555938 [Tanacetum coccineum]
MDDLNITMEEYIRLEEEKAQRHGRTFKWQTATFRKVENCEDEDDCFIDFETEFPAIVFDNTLPTLPSEPTVCPPNENKIDFIISLDESDDEDYTVIFDEKSFLYKIISINDLKTDSGNDNDNMPSSPNLIVDYFDDLDFFKDFENEFPAIVYNDAQTSKLDYLTELILNPQHIDEFNLNDETSLSEYDEEEQNCSKDMAPLPAVDQRHPWLRYQVKGYTEGIRHSYKQRLEKIWSRLVNRVYVLDFEGLTPEMRQDLAMRLRMVYTGGEGQMSDSEMGLDVADTLCFQLGGVRRRMTWRQFILALGLHMEQEMAEDGFGAYWDGSDRLILDKGDLRDYWIEISSDRDFLGPAPSYVLIRDLVRRLYHRMIAYSISSRGQAPEKVTGIDLFYLRSMDRGTTNVPHLLAQYLFRHAQGKKSGATLSGGHFIGRLAMHYGLAAAAGAHGADEAGLATEEGAQEIPAPAQAPPPAPQP